MIDALDELNQDQAHLDRCTAAAESRHVVTIRFELFHGEPMLHIDANHPVLINVTGDTGYMMSGAAVNHLPGQLPIGMNPIGDEAVDGVTELRLSGENGRVLVIPIGPKERPQA